MAQQFAAVRRAPAGSDLVTHPEHCSVDPRLLAALDRPVGAQVRVTGSDGAAVLYTVSETSPESRAAIVRMGRTGRLRLGTDLEFDGTIDPEVPHPTMSEADAAARSEFIERLTDDGHERRLVAIAPHGGRIEPHTDQQAERVAARLGVSSWRCKGWDAEPGRAGVRWHITATDIHASSFPLLGTIAGRRFTYAVAFHGEKDTGVLIGGRAAVDLRRAVGDAIAAALAGTGICVRLAGPDDDLGGDDPRNLVNRLTARLAGGLQIEQSAAARRHHGAAIADAVASVYAGVLARR